MRCYMKPELFMVPFDAEDLIFTRSSSLDDDMGGLDWAAAPDYLDTEFVNDLTVENPSGAFDAQVSGGNPVQEALNTLYENFADLL